MEEHIYLSQLAQAEPDEAGSTPGTICVNGNQEQLRRPVRERADKATSKST